MNLDVLVAVMTGLLAVCAFTLLNFSSARARNWLTLPRHIRYGIFVTGTLLMIRSVNLFSLAERSDAGPGSVNYEAVAVTVAMAYTVGAFTLWIWTQRVPGRVMDRVLYAFGGARKDHEMVPVMMPMSEVIDIHHARGVAATGPGEPSQAVVREARRHRA